MFDPGTRLLDPLESLGSSDNSRSDEATRGVGVDNRSIASSSFRHWTSSIPGAAAWSSDSCSAFVVGMITLSRLVVLHLTDRCGGEGRQGC